MRVLVTGSNGFIGQNMVNALEPHHEVVKNEWGMSFPGVEGLDWVIHLGAISSTVETNISKIYRQNLDFSIKLYEECIKHNVKFQFASSASVYGLKSDFKETSPVAPQNHYARSKALFEKYVEFRNAPLLHTYLDILTSTDLTKNIKVSKQVHKLSFCSKLKRLVK